MQTRHMMLLAWALIALPRQAGAAIIHVPADQPTIQAAINASTNGDTILVANGVYTGPGNRDIVFSNKGIALISEGGSSNCIIDLQGHTGIRVGVSEDEFWNPASLSIDGFTFRNAGSNGEIHGAIYVDMGSELSAATRCQFADNEVGIFIAVFGEAFGVSRCLFVRNGDGIVDFGDECYVDRCAF